MPKSEVGGMGMGESGLSAPSGSLCSTCQDHGDRQAACPLQPQASQAAAVHSGLLPKEPRATFMEGREYVGGKEGGAGKEGERRKEGEEEGE